MGSAAHGRLMNGMGVVASLAISMAACGGGEDSADGPSPTPLPTSPSPTSVEITSPTTEAPPATTTEPVPEITEPDEPDEEFPEALELVWQLQIDDVLGRADDVAFDPKSELVVIGSVVGYVHHLADGELVDVIRYWYGGPSTLAYSPDGALVAAGFAQGRVALTTPEGAIPAGLEDLVQFDGFDGAHLDAQDWDLTVAFTPDGDRLVTSSRSGLVQVWSLPEAQVVTSFEAPDANDRRAGVSLTTTVLEVHPGGELVGAVDFDCHLNVWNIDTGAVVHSFPLDRIGCSLGRTFRFSPDGTAMAAAINPADGDQVVRIWNVDDASVVVDLPVPEWNVNDLSFSPDSTMLMTSADSGVFTPAVIWDVADATVLHEVGDPTALDAARMAVARFTPDGGHVLIGYANGTVELWRLPGAEVLTPPQRQPCDPVPIPGDVLFDTASATLRPDADPLLAELAQQLADGFPEAALTFVGHTDSRGSDEANRQLSLDRAEAVRDWFAAWATAAGLDGWVLQIDGLGAAQPRVADLDGDGNFLPEAGAVNRRVEISIEADGCAS